jgi:hypothetical protein
MKENNNNRLRNIRLAKIIESFCILIERVSGGQTFVSELNAVLSVTLDAEEEKKNAEAKKGYCLDDIIPQLKRKAASKINSRLNSEFQLFGNFVYINIKSINIVKPGELTFMDTAFLYEVEINATIIVNTRLLLGDSKLAIAHLNYAMSAHFNCIVNFECSKILFLSCVHKNETNTISNSINIWSDQKWNNHYLYMFYPRRIKNCTIPLQSHYIVVSELLTNFDEEHEMFLLPIAFSSGNHFDDDELTIIGYEVRESFDGTGKDNSKYFIKGFNQDSGLSVEMLINLIQLYFYKNNLLISELEKPSFLPIFSNLRLWRRILNSSWDNASSNIPLLNNSQNDNITIVFMQELPFKLEQILIEIRLSYPLLYANQISERSLDLLINDYSERAIKLILSRPLCYLPKQY